MVSKKASREQATLAVDVHTGVVELTVLGKNGMMWRPEEHVPWTHLPRSGTARLRTHSEFSLLGRIGALRAETLALTLSLSLRPALVVH